MGETNYGVSPDEVVRHEYGHHIALNRINSPWLAVSWGPKNWASASSVCRRAADGSAYPGDEGDNYRLNPGAAWAETYRLLVERKAGVTGSSWESSTRALSDRGSARRGSETSCRHGSRRRQPCRLRAFVDRADGRGQFRCERRSTGASTSRSSSRKAVSTTASY